MVILPAIRHDRMVANLKERPHASHTPDGARTCVESQISRGLSLTLRTRTRKSSADEVEVKPVDPDADKEIRRDPAPTSGRGCVPDRVDLCPQCSEQKVCANFAEGGTLAEGLVAELVERDIDPKIQELVHGAIHRTADVISGLCAVSEIGKRKGATGVNTGTEMRGGSDLRLSFVRQNEEC